MFVDNLPEGEPLSPQELAKFESEQAEIEALTQEVEAFWARQDAIRAEEVTKGKGGRAFSLRPEALPWAKGDFDALPVDY